MEAVLFYLLSFYCFVMITVLELESYVQIQSNYTNFCKNIAWNDEYDKLKVDDCDVE